MELPHVPQEDVRWFSHPPHDWSQQIGRATSGESIGLLAADGVDGRQDGGDGSLRVGHH
jgi:hypothetical protein